MSSEAQPRFDETLRFRFMRRVMGTLNPALRAVLGAPGGGPLNRALMLLEYRGHRSGRTFRTPVGFVRHGRRVIAVTLPSYRWWRSIAGGAQVRIKLEGRWHGAYARIVGPADPGYDELIALHVRLRGPNMLRAFGLPVSDDGRIPPEEREDAGRRAHLVLFELSQPAHTRSGE